ncbi:MAG TPA: pyrroline-5-carboxylate reductase [Rhabdochlamydiaceae bacterium]|nr:pyrroline-5-carboxylate reductase [Rhabdochlamydiaceae bacterium]
MNIAIIGCGVMGAAFARHFAKKEQLLLCDRQIETAESLAKELGAKACKSAKEAAQQADLIFLAMKPADLSAVVKELNAVLTKNHLVVSILAGTTLETLKKGFPHTPILRMIPNLAITCEVGVLGLVEDSLINPALRKKIEKLFSGLGLIVWLPESKIDALTALAGSGPAFIFVLVEAMIDSGVLLGFSHQEAREFALKTIQGSIELLQKTGKTPSELKWQVASPKGTTIAGIKALEKAGFRNAIMSAFSAAYERAKEMHK